MQLTDKMLKAIEFAVESRMNLDSEEQCTIIASPQLCEAIKISIAEGKIFSTIYGRLIFSENPAYTDEFDLTIIPDSVIEESIQEQIKEHLDHNEEVKGKLGELNEMMGDLDEETLTKISFTDEKDLTTEELELKNKIQLKMMEVGMNVDLLFSAQQQGPSKDVVDKVFNTVSNYNSTVNVKGL